VIRSKGVRTRAMAALLAATLPLGAAAQAPGARTTGADGWSLRTGGGLLFTPAYLGADDYQLAALPDIKIAYGDRFFASVQDGIGYRVIKAGGLSLGPIARPGFGRPESGANPFRIAGPRTDDLRGLGEIASTVEFGGFARYTAGAFSAQIEGRQAVSGHDGFVGDVDLSYTTVTRALGKTAIVSVGPSARFGDAVHNGAFFGVDAAQSAASGLPVYNPDGGLVSYGLGATSVVMLNRRVAATFLASYTRVAGEAADAPLVTERGTRNQFVSGIFLSYTWGGAPRR